LRVLTLRGQTKVHLPQNIHLAISFNKLFVSPREIITLTKRKLKFVKFAALQVPAHEPQAMHNPNDGSTTKILDKIILLLLSKSTWLSLFTVYPQFGIFYLVISFWLFDVSMKIVSIIS